MSEKQSLHTPDFFSEAGEVMNSPYWKVEDIEDPKEQTTKAVQRFNERTVLSQALRLASKYEDLKGNAKAIYDRAKAAMESK